MSISGRETDLPDYIESSLSDKEFLGVLRSQLVQQFTAHGSVFVCRGIAIVPVLATLLIP